MRLATAVCILVLLPAAAAAAAAQREVMTVEVVQVPVYATHDGEAVTGLTREDFELLVNGRRQAIDYFDVIDFAGLAAGARSAARTDGSGTASSKAVVSSPVQRRMYLLLFDVLFTHPKFVARAQTAAERTIASSLPTDFFAIVVYSRSRGLQLLVPFTQDRNALFPAIASLTLASSQDPLRLAVEATERAQRPEVDKDPGDELLPPNSAAMTEMLEEPVRHNIMDEFTAIGALAARLAPLEGIKHVVLLGDGFDGRMFHGAGSPSTRRSEGLTQRPLGSATDLMGPLPSAAPATNGPALKVLAAMHRQFTTAGVFLDAVNVAGVPEFEDWNPARDEALFMMTKPTGGEVVHYENDLLGAMQSLARKQQVAYVLGFHARPTGRRLNAISVKLRKAGDVQLRYRPSYATEVARTPANDGLQLADILANDIPQTGISLNLTTAVTDKVAHITAEIPSAELFALAGDRRMTGEALIYIYSGVTVVAFAQNQVVADPAARAHGGGEIVRMAHDFELPPGSYAAKVLVRFDDRATLGFARGDFTVGR